MKICREDWEKVVEKACDIVNAGEDDPMSDVHLEAMMCLLDDLESKYGRQAAILATRADFLDSYAERRSLYEEALALARKANDSREIEEILDSIKWLEAEKD